jgi:hypothetical protein
MTLFGRPTSETDTHAECPDILHVDSAHCRLKQHFNRVTIYMSSVYRLGDHSEPVTGAITAADTPLL